MPRLLVSLWSPARPSWHCWSHTRRRRRQWTGGTPLLLCCCLLLLLYRTCLAACPNGCDCRWKSGKETVECSNAGFIDVPEGLDQGTQVLEMAHNNLQVLPKDTFLSAGLLNLQRIYLQHCHLRQIDQEAFRRLSNLVELDISSNDMAYIPTAAFAEVPDLRRLLLSHNPLQRVEDDAFAVLPSLTTLELSHCELKRIGANAFRGLEKLGVLKLDGNQLTTLAAATLTPLRKLQGINFQGNPWLCDCHLRPSRQWMLKYNLPLSVPPACQTPQRLANLTWDKLPLDDFACDTEATLEQDQFDVAENDNVTFSCWVTGNPEPVVRWVHKGRTIANLSLGPSGNKLYLIHEEGSTEKVNNLTVTSVQEDDSGVYSCIAENRANRVVINVTLTVQIKETEDTGFTLGQISGILVGGVLFVLLMILIICVVIVSCRRRKHREKRRVNLDKHVVNALNHKEAAIAALEKHSLAFLGPNPVQKPPRMGHYQGVPTTDLDHIERSFLENSLGPVWVKSDSNSGYGDDNDKLTPVVEEDEDKTIGSWPDELPDPIPELPLDIEAGAYQQQELNEQENYTDPPQEQQFQPCNASSPENSCASDKDCEIHSSDEREKGQLEYDDRENAWKDVVEMPPTPTNTPKMTPKSKPKPPKPKPKPKPRPSVVVPTDGSSSYAAPEWNKVPLLSPPRGEHFRCSKVSVFEDGNDGTQV